MRTKVAVLGAGEAGRAMEHVLYKNHAEVAIWDPNPRTIPGQSPLAATLPQADLVFLCVPSWLARETIFRLGSHLPPDVPVVAFLPGVDKVIGKTMDEVLTRFLPQNQPWAVFGGPLLPKELIRDMGGVSVAASENKGIFYLLEKCLKPELKLEYSSDTRGVTLACTAKNVYALAWGMAEGLSWGLNKRSWIITQALNEMAEIVNFLGGNIETSFGPAGLANLLASSLSADSLEYRVGWELVNTHQTSFKCEGMESLPVLSALLGDKKDRLPLFKVLESVGVDGKNARASFNEVFGGD